MSWSSDTKVGFVPAEPYFIDYCDVLRVRHRESKKLRSLLQLIMDQRSELEHFFIEAITTVDKAVSAFLGKI